MTELALVQSGGELSTLQEDLEESYRGIEEINTGADIMAQGWIRFAKAAEKIRREESYKEELDEDGNPKTWTQFCREKWHRERETVNSLINHGRFLEGMRNAATNERRASRPIEGLEFPTAQKHIRALKHAKDESEALNIWREKVAPRIQEGQRVSRTIIEKIIRGEDPDDADIVQQDEEPVIDLGGGNKLTLDEARDYILRIEAERAEPENQGEEDEQEDEGWTDTEDVEEEQEDEPEIKGFYLDDGAWVGVEDYEKLDEALKHIYKYLYKENDDGELEFSTASKEARRRLAEDPPNRQFEEARGAMQEIYKLDQYLQPFVQNLVADAAKQVESENFLYQSARSLQDWLGVLVDELHRRAQHEEWDISELEESE